MKSLEELAALRERMKNNVAMRQDNSTATRVVVGMATCGIAAGARPVHDEVAHRVRFVREAHFIQNALDVPSHAPLVPGDAVDVGEFL